MIGTNRSMLSRKRILRLPVNMMFMVCLTLLALFLIFPGYTVLGVDMGINLCIQNVIPSLFCFFVLAGIMVQGDLPKPPQFISNVLKGAFKVSRESIIPIILGVLSGFPVPAAAIAKLYRAGSITRGESHILLSFCNNISASFVIVMVGYKILGSLNVGMALYMIQMVSSLATGMIYCRLFKEKQTLREMKPNFEEHKKNKGAATIFTTAVKDAAVNMLYVCAFVVFFSALIVVIGALFSSFGSKWDFVLRAFCRVLELTTAVTTFYGAISPLALAGLSAVMGFSGLCVICQIAAVISDSGLSLKPVIVGKILTSIIAFLLTLFFYPLISTII